MDFHKGHDETPLGGTKKYFPPPAQCEDWNFLKGTGPSAPQSAAGEEHKFKPSSFHSKWNRKRPEDSIRPYDERSMHETVRTTRIDGCYTVRKQNLQSWNVKNSFNPITGQELSPSGSWGAAKDPWAHQKLGLKPTKQPGMSREAVERKMQGADARRNMRAERMANDGLTTSMNIRTSSVRDNFDPVNM